jgi:hypothetical protein
MPSADNGTYPNKRDCEHGYLRRSCPYCERDAYEREVQELDRLMLHRRRDAEQVRDALTGWDRRDASNYADGWRDAEDVIREWIKAHV